MNLGHYASRNFLLCQWLAKASLGDEISSRVETHSLRKRPTPILSWGPVTHLYLVQHLGCSVESGVIPEHNWCGSKNKRKRKETKRIHGACVWLQR